MKREEMPIEVDESLESNVIYFRNQKSEIIELTLKNFCVKPSDIVEAKVIAPGDAAKSLSGDPGREFGVISNVTALWIACIYKQIELGGRKQLLKCNLEDACARARREMGCE